jgi:hypothetical protein
VPFLWRLVPLIADCQSAGVPPAQDAWSRRDDGESFDRRTILRYVARFATRSRSRGSGEPKDEDPRWLNAAVTILETHNIIELSRACLKDDRVLQGCHAVPSAGAEMNCLPGEQLE